MRTRNPVRLLLTCLIAAVVLPGCTDDPEPAGLAEGNGGAPWQDLRGIIHAHSIYSHDACDGRPEGNTECLTELREALCATGQDYILLTDHEDTFADHDFPGVLLYLPGEGDQLLTDSEGLPYANLIPCPDREAVTVLAGTENDLMPVHLHRHQPGSAADRHALYGRKDPAAVPLLRDLGASVIVNHAEGWSQGELIGLAPDGVEVFNLHSAIDPDLRPLLGVDPWSFVLDLLAFLLDPQLPDPDKVIMTFWPETRAWTDRWDALLGVQRCYGIVATDAHRNALPFDLSDGDRADGYRRMMQFFGNHLLARDRSPAAIEEALDSGRAYAAFDFLGTPEGFAFDASDGAAKYDMGDEAHWRQGLTLHVRRPALPEAGLPAPSIRTRLIRIDASGSQEVAGGEADIAYEASPGRAAYRAEVLIVPHHLAPALGSQADRLIHEYPWIYGNPIYVRASGG